MTTLLLIYETNDIGLTEVEYVVQSISSTGVKVKLLAWNMQLMKSLWSMAEQNTMSEAECDAWIFYGSQSGIAINSCRMEIEYAFYNVRQLRGPSFPIVALYAAPAARATAATTLPFCHNVFVTDSAWVDHVEAALDDKSRRVNEVKLPYYVQIHEYGTPPNKMYTIEIRPQASTWEPFALAIPRSERDSIRGRIAYGAAGQPGAAKSDNIKVPFPNGIPSDGGDWLMFIGLEVATPSQSYFFECRALPSKIAFGPDDEQLYVHGLLSGDHHP